MNVPRLRFKEFTDEWIKIDLSTSFEYFSTNSLSREQLSDHGAIKNIHYGDIHKKYENVVDVENDVATYIKDAEQINKYEFCCENDIIFADASEDYNGIGKAIELINVNENLVSGLHTIHARDKKQFFSPMFKGYYFNTPVIHNQIRILANGFKVFGISKDNINNLKVTIPSKQEQEKIAQFLSLLDKKIELQTKKIEALKLFKLCISNLCFNDHKNWNYKISDFCYITTSTSKIKYIDSSGKRYIMDMGTINSDGNIIYSKPTNYNKDLLNKGDLIMPKDDIGGGLIIGKTAYIDQNNKYILGDHVFCLKSKNINSLYLHYLINSSYINKSLRKKVTGSAQLGINSKNVLNQDIFIHEKKVQDVIANTLFKIDSKILLNKIKLEKLLSLKKGFMQNMFV